MNIYFLLRDHHLLWIKQTHDYEVIRRHSDIADLIRQLEERYQALLKSLQT